MSRKSIQAINWAPLAERVLDSERNAFNTFKAKADQFLRRMTANPEAPPKIDWAYYRKTITTPGLVDKFQKEYESLKVPYPTDKYTADIEAKQKAVVAELSKSLRAANEMIQNIKDYHTVVEFSKNPSELSLEEYAELNPDCLKLGRGSSMETENGEKDSEEKKDSH